MKRHLLRLSLLFLALARSSRADLVYHGILFPVHTNFDWMPVALLPNTDSTLHLFNLYPSNFTGKTLTSYEGRLRVLFPTGTEIYGFNGVPGLHNLITDFRMPPGPQL